MGISDSGKLRRGSEGTLKLRGCETNPTRLSSMVRAKMRRFETNSTRLSRAMRAMLRGYETNPKLSAMWIRKAMAIEVLRRRH